MNKELKQSLARYNQSLLYLRDVLNVLNGRRIHVKYIPSITTIPTSEIERAHLRYTQAKTFNELFKAKSDIQRLTIQDKNKLNNYIEFLDAR